MIKSVRLKNFKSFRDARINLGIRNVLVGPNMSGKSNFIGAFRFLRQMCFPPEPGLWGLANAFGAFGGSFAEFTWKGEDSRLMVIGLDGASSEPGGIQETEWSYEISVVGDERGSVRVQEERLSLSRTSHTHELIVVKDGIRSLVNIDGRQLYANVDSNRAALEFDVPDWDGSFLRRSISLWRFYRLVPPLMRQANPAAAPPWLTESGDNLSSWLMHLQTRYADAFARIKQVCQDVLPGLADVFTWPTQQATVVLGSREKHLKRPLSIWEMSDGELAFLAFLSLISAPQELAGSLYCVEELENHLHPKLIETLMELLKQVQEQLSPQDPLAQVIGTTHSPYLVDKASLDELIVFEKRQGATSVTYPRDKTHLRKLLEDEELGLGDLFYSGALQGG